MMQAGLQSKIMQLQDVRQQQGQADTNSHAQERLALNEVAAAQAALESAEERRHILIDSRCEVGDISPHTLFARVCDLRHLIVSERPLQTHPWSLRLHHIVLRISVLLRGSILKRRRAFAQDPCS